MGSAAPPLVVVVSGCIASGKSTIARRVAEQIDAVLLVADLLREGAVAEMSRDAPPLQARLRALARPIDDAVYEALLRRARGALAGGRSVVLDAGFPRRELRDEARALAGRHGARFRLLWCRASSADVRERLAARAVSQGVAIDRWLAPHEAFDAEFEAPLELQPAERLELDTSGTAARSGEAAVAWLAAARGG